MEAVAITEVKNGIGWIKINRPQVINSINEEVVRIMLETLETWKNDDDVALVCLYGEGDRGFCAGGDMRVFYDMKDNGVEAYAKDFFDLEYELDYEIHEYKKPIVAYMNGIIMGGGVGLAIGATHRIVTEKTKWAMPEMNIGFFPDVGGSYFLNHLPGHSGRYLALTAEMIKASDTLYAEVADYYLESEKWQDLMNALNENNWSHDSVEQDLDRILAAFSTTTDAPSELMKNQEKIDKHFKHDSMEDIVLSLETAATEGDEWADRTLKTLLTKSPTSLKVTLRQLIKGKDMTLWEALEMEKKLAMNFMDCPDFYEGLRAVLVDKDRSPKWNPSKLEEVLESDINQFFL
ncbi:enoyl-CoA hydratase/isomerase family protein [Sporosarcina sp. CAU 1771]